MSEPHPLRKYRAEHGKTLADLAAQFDVNKSTLMRWESGAVPTPLERIPDIEKLTGISRHELRPDFFGARPADLGENAAEAPACHANSEAAALQGGAL